MTRRSLLAAAPAAAVITRQPRFYHAWATLALRRNGELLVAYSGGREGHI